jgi:hypothetical protein
MHCLPVTEWRYKAAALTESSASVFQGLIISAGDKSSNTKIVTPNPFRLSNWRSSPPAGDINFFGAGSMR